MIKIFCALAMALCFMAPAAEAFSLKGAAKAVAKPFVYVGKEVVLPTVACAGLLGKRTVECTGKVLLLPFYVMYGAADGLDLWCNFE